MPVSESKFHADRASGIGATDSPKILGESKWGGPLSVYLSKTDPGDPDSPSLPARVGIALEPMVAQLWSEDTGVKLRADKRHYRHPARDWMVCHLDYRPIGDRSHIVECKTRSSASGFGEDGSPIIPRDIWIQVQHELAVTGAKTADVAVLIGFTDFRVHPVVRDDDFINGLYERIDQFWHDHVIPRVPPPAGRGDGPTIARAHPSDDGSILTADDSQQTLLGAYASARAYLADAEATVEEIESVLKQHIGDATGIAGSSGTVTWKRSRDREVIDWKAVAQDAGAQPWQIDLRTTLRGGNRIFRWSPSGKSSTGDDD